MYSGRPFGCGGARHCRFTDASNVLVMLWLGFGELAHVDVGAVLEVRCGMVGVLVQTKHSSYHVHIHHFRSVSSPQQENGSAVHKSSFLPPITPFQRPAFPANTMLKSDPNYLYPRTLALCSITRRRRLNNDRGKYPYHVGHLEMQG